MVRFYSPSTFRLQIDKGVQNVNMLESGSPEETDFNTNVSVSEVPVETLLEEGILDDSSKETWLEAPTRMFVSLLLKMQPQLGKTFDLKNKNKMWQQIQKTLADEGYNFSVKQVQTKYRTMERKYRLTRHRTKTGRERKSCPYESDLDKLFGEKKRACPEFVLGNREFKISIAKVSTSNNAMDDENSKTSIPGITTSNSAIGNNNFNISLPKISTKNNAPSTSDESCTPAPIRIKRSESVHGKILRKLDEIHKEKAKFHASLLQRLQSKEKIEQERNDLLKRIASSLENNFNLYIETQHCKQEI